MRDKIILSDDPFSIEYFARFTDLTESIGPLLGGDNGPYIAYLKERRRRASRTLEPDAEQAYCENLAGCKKALAESIRDDGYDPNAWRHCGRDFDYNKGEGPITVTIGPDGTINSYDGLHRSAILRHLGQPVIAEVYQRNKRWVELREFHKTLYTPYPHPDFAGRKVLRKGVERFDAIGKWMKEHDAYCPLVVGACIGWGMFRLLDVPWNSQVYGIEPQKERRDLAGAFISRLGRGMVQGKSAIEWDEYDKVGAVIGLSVYHHVATSLDQWQKVADKLAACPVQILELPEDSAKQWHNTFRAECGGRCKETILSVLAGAGDYMHREVIYTDRTYANRETIAMWRD